MLRLYPQKGATRLFCLACSRPVTVCSVHDRRTNSARAQLNSRSARCIPQSATLGSSDLVPNGCPPCQCILRNAQRHAMCSAASMSSVLHSPHDRSGLGDPDLSGRTQPIFCSDFIMVQEWTNLWKVPISRFGRVPPQKTFRTSLQSFGSYLSAAQLGPQPTVLCSQHDRFG